MRALLLALLCLLPALPTLAQPQTPPDIIVVLLDDMRADDWQALPETQVLLKDGTWFENFILTTPQCCPSRATLLTGRYAHNHGARTNNIGYPGMKKTGAHEATLSILLHAEGYRTALVGKFMHGYDSSRPPPGWDSWYRESGLSYNTKEGYVTDAMRKRAVAVIEKTTASGDPLFLWFAVKAPHGPATPARRHRDAFPDAEGADRDRLRSLLAVDEAVVAIAEGMGPRWARACVLVLSDNGYLLGDHDHVGKTIWWDEAVRVPMLARCPGLTPGGDNRLAASIDIAPTILQAAGLRVPTNMDGRTLHDAWNRDGVLVENWAEHPFVGVKTRDALYVVPKGEAPALYMLADGEARDHLTPSEAATWAARLDALRGCAGQACRDADGG